jgi:hypothetical protein
MPGTGTLRRSSTPVRKKAIVGKSRVGATGLERLSFVFLALAMAFRSFQISTAKNLWPKRMTNWVAASFPVIGGLFFGNVAQDQLIESASFHTRHTLSWDIHLLDQIGVWSVAWSGLGFLIGTSGGGGRNSESSKRLRT